MDTSSNKLVSVVIPAYNYGRYIGECIDSVLNQTYKNIEIIVVDDESTDNTKDVCEQYPTVKYIWQKNKGLSGARNTGITQAKGEYITCLDADDKLLPGAVEEHVGLMEDDMVVAQCALMEFGERHVVMTPTKDTSLERVMQSNTIYCNAMFSKRMWELSGGYDESTIMRLGYEDWEFWIQLLALGCRVRTSDMIALRYRAHANNMTKETTWPNHQKLYRYIYNKHIELYESKNLTVAGLTQEND